MNHGRNCPCHSCCMTEAAIIRARQQAEYATKDHGGDRSGEEGWHEAMHGFISSATGHRPVTFTLGFDAREGEALVADGFISIHRPGPFWETGSHTYYGKEHGLNCSQLNRGIVAAPPIVTNDPAEQQQADAIGRQWVWPKSYTQHFLD